MFGSRSIACQDVRPDLVAWVDGELQSRLARRVGAHVRDCPFCSREVEALRGSIDVQRSFLRNASDSAAAVDVDALWRRLEPRLQLTTPESRWRKAVAAWMWRPALAFAGASVALWLGVSALGGSETVLISLGLESPPPALRQEPDLFRDYAIIRQLDILEHLDNGESPVPDAATPAAQQG